MADKNKSDKPATPANPVPNQPANVTKGPEFPIPAKTAGPAHPSEPTGANPLPASAVDGGANPGRNDPLQASGSDPGLAKMQDHGSGAGVDIVGGPRQGGPLSGDNVGPSTNTLNADGSASGSRLGRAPAVEGFGGFDFFVEVRAFMAAGRDLDAPKMLVHGGRLLTMAGEALGGADGGTTVVNPSLMAATDEEAKFKAAEMEKLAAEFAAFKDEANGKAHHFTRPDYYRHGLASGAPMGMAQPRAAAGPSIDPGTIVSIIELVSKLIEWFRKK